MNYIFCKLTIRTTKKKIFYNNYILKKNHKFILKQKYIFELFPENDNLKYKKH